MTINDLELFLVERQSETTDPSIRSLLDSTSDGFRAVSVGGRPPFSGALRNSRARRDVLLSILTGRSVFDIEELLDQEALRPRPPAGRRRNGLLGSNRTYHRDLPLSCLCSEDSIAVVFPLGVRLHGSSIEQVLQLSREMADQGFHWQTLSATGRHVQVTKNVVTALLEGSRRSSGTATRRPPKLHYAEQAQELCQRLERSGPRLHPRSDRRRTHGRGRVPPKADHRHHGRGTICGNPRPT